MNYSVKTLAARWGCSQEIVDNLINAGQLGAFPIGPRTIRIPEREVERVAQLIADNETLPVVTAGRPKLTLPKKPVPDFGVYVIDCDRFSKIGYTGQTFRARVGSYKTSNPFPVVLWAIAPGTREHERRLLEAFRQYQHRDDWMILDADGRQKLRRRILSMGGAIVGGKA